MPFVRASRYVIIVNSFDLTVMSGIDVLEVTEFVSIFKIEVAQFFLCLTILARKLIITQDRWVVRARGNLYRV